MEEKQQSEQHLVEKAQRNQIPSEIVESVLFDSNKKEEQEDDKEGERKKEKESENI